MIHKYFIRGKEFWELNSHWWKIEDGHPVSVGVHVIRKDWEQLRDAWEKLIAEWV